MISPEMLEELENINFENVPYSDAIYEGYQLASQRRYYEIITQVLETSRKPTETTAKGMKEMLANVERHNAERDQNCKALQANMAQIEDADNVIKSADQQSGDYQQLMDQANLIKSQIDSSNQQLDQLGQQVYIQTSLNPKSPPGPAKIPDLFINFF